MKQKFTHSTEQKIERSYFKKSTTEYTKIWYKIARNNRKAGIPIEDTLEQLNLVLQGIRLRIDFEHDVVTQQETHIKTLQEKILQKYQNNFKDFVAAEMIKLPERKFRRMDRLKAIFEKLKNRMEEFKQITSL
jgi:hypothetical protein